MVPSLLLGQCRVRGRRDVRGCEIIVGALTTARESGSDAFVGNHVANCCSQLCSGSPMIGQQGQGRERDGDARVNPVQDSENARFFKVIERRYSMFCGRNHLYRTVKLKEERVEK